MKYSILNLIREHGKRIYFWCEIYFFDECRFSEFSLKQIMKVKIIFKYCCIWQEFFLVVLAIAAVSADVSHIGYNYDKPSSSFQDELSQPITPKTPQPPQPLQPIPNNLYLPPQQQSIYGKGLKHISQCGNNSPFILFVSDIPAPPVS